MSVFKAEISNILLTSNNWSFKIHVLASSLLSVITLCIVEKK